MSPGTNDKVGGVKFFPGKNTLKKRQNITCQVLQVGRGSKGDLNGVDLDRGQAGQGIQNTPGLLFMSRPSVKKGENGKWFHITLPVSILYNNSYQSKKYDRTDKYSVY